jgi:hypothetical protein
MILVNDPYDLVPELFEAFDDFGKSPYAHIDVLLITVPEATEPSNNLTIFIDPEPTMHCWQELFCDQLTARPNSVIAVSGYYTNKQHTDSNVQRINFWLHGSLTVQNNPGLAILDYSSKKPYVANALLGGWSQARGIMIDKLRQLGLLEQCIVNYFDGAPVDEKTRAMRKQQYPEYFFNYRSPILNEIDNPIFKAKAFVGNDKINTCTPIPDSRFGRPTWVSQIITEQIYQQTYLSIVAETDAGDSVFFISEKIAKPLLIGHPFVVYGCKGYLAELHKIGFKTFGNWIDESYDSIDNKYDRARAVIDSVDKFASLSDSKRIKISQEMQLVLQHNQQLISSSKWLSQSIADQLYSYPVSGSK